MVASNCTTSKRIRKITDIKPQLNCKLKFQVHEFHDRGTFKAIYYDLSAFEPLVLWMGINKIGLSSVCFLWGSYWSDNWHK